MGNGRAEGSPLSGKYLVVTKEDADLLLGTLLYVKMMGERDGTNRAAFIDRLLNRFRDDAGERLEDIASRTRLRAVPAYESVQIIHVLMERVGLGGRVMGLYNSAEGALERQRAEEFALEERGAPDHEGFYIVPMPLLVDD